MCIIVHCTIFIINATIICNIYYELQLFEYTPSLVCIVYIIHCTLYTHTIDIKKDIVLDTL